MWADRIYYEGSTLIKSSKYNHEEHLLEIVFVNGETKEYEKIPSALAAELEECSKGKGSAGQLYKDKIKDFYSTKENG